jgi:peptidoglycan/xylan/chitin deacetylase (PgdA/CDA1 family)
MIPFKIRIIREQNRAYTNLIRLLSVFQKGPKVYLFHDLLDNKNDVKNQFAISQTSFENFLLKKLELGHKPMSFNELTELIEGKLKESSKLFYISFDDCNTSVYTKAYPFLIKHKIPFILFIAKDLIGKKNFLTAEQIMTMAKDPLCTIGSHALHHKMFRYMSEEEAQNEFKKSRTYLQQLSGQKVECFAFPYGRLVEVSCTNIKQLEQTDYKFAFSAIAGNIGQQWLSGKYYLPRINVSEALVSRSLTINH